MVFEYDSVGGDGLERWWSSGWEGKPQGTMVHGMTANYRNIYDARWDDAFPKWQCHVFGTVQQEIRSIS